MLTEIYQLFHASWCLLFLFWGGGGGLDKTDNGVEVGGILRTRFFCMTCNCFKLLLSVHRNRSNVVLISILGLNLKCKNGPVCK